MTRPVFCVAFGVVLLACGGKAATKQSIPPTPVTTDPTPPKTDPPPASTSPNVGVSDDLAKQCRLRLANVEQAPKFGYDDDLLPVDRDMLQQVAECLVHGPLQGRTVELVGRTDPRGTDECDPDLTFRSVTTLS